MGRRLDDLGTPALSWRDLLVIVRQCGPASALARAKSPELAAWAAGQLTADLLALVADQLAVANWQRQGKRSAKRPKRIQRPGADTDKQTFGSAPIPVRDFDDWWSSERR